MADYRHYYRCQSCGQHLVNVTESIIPTSPGLTHHLAAQNGALPITKTPDTMTCGGLGKMMYCSGAAVVKGQDPLTEKGYANCVPRHPGTEEIVAHRPQAVPADWTDFVARVSTAWNTYVASGYSPALRGVNNNREYRTTAVVSGILQSAGGSVMINGATYAISISNSAGVSIKRSIPPAYQTDTIKSFIFHL